MGVAADCTLIIPARNAEATLGACLKSVYASEQIPGQVIVVNDSSRDATSRVAGMYPCQVLDVAIARGPMQPRFAGARAATGSILIFIDADVCVKPDSFTRVLTRFHADPQLGALTGLLSREGDQKGFFSEYKNEYMNYIFTKQPEAVSFLYGSIWAVRKEQLIYFEPISKPFGSLVSDSEMGFRLKMKGLDIRLDHGLEVKHLKRYSFVSLMQNDFKIPFLFALMLLAYRQCRIPARERGFSHTTLGQAMVMGIPMTALFFAAAALVGRHPVWVWAAWGLVGILYVYWMPFFIRLYERGWRFLLKALLFKPLDTIVMSCGVVCGLVYFVFSKDMKRFSL